MAIVDPTAGGNPVELDKKAAKKIFKAALEGRDGADHGGAGGVARVLLDYEKSLRSLNKEFPDRPQYFMGLMEVAQMVNPEKGLPIAKEVAGATKAPEQIREMAKGLNAPRAELSDYAPRLLTMKIHPDKIRDVIGKGGVTIRAITEETGAIIDIADDGTITIASNNQANADAAKKRIEQITSDVEPGRIYEGKVAKLMDFGAFVTIAPGKDGLVHVSQISNDRVEKVSDVLKEGDVVKVKVLEVDKQGRIRLSMKAVAEGEGAPA